MKIEIYKEDQLKGCLFEENGKIKASGDIEFLKNILSHYEYLKEPSEILEYMHHHLRSYIWAKKVED